MSPLWYLLISLIVYLFYMKKRCLLAVIIMCAENMRYVIRPGFAVPKLSLTSCTQDVDQRLTRDVERLCDDLSALIPSMVKPVVDIAWFSLQLYQLTGRRGMAILYMYAFLGFGALRAVTPDFGALAKKVRLA